MCYGWKGGIGTASRVLPSEGGGFTVGALLQTNFGSPADLVIAGDPVGRRLPRPADLPAPADGPGPGSVMIVLATDAPLDSRQLGRLCRRAVAGLARTGSFLSHGSGDFVIAFSTANRIPHHPPALIAERPVLVDEGRGMGYLFRAVIEAVEEAVLNSLFAARTVVGRDGHVAHRLPYLVGV
jgi:D-aminopeptidase